jgi:leader peptidase (prepilin peptidase) / N-methyltransferase
LTTTQVVLVVAGTFLYLLIGSFICVIIDRLPVQLDEPNEYGDSWETRPWREVLGGRSRCSTCGDPVRPVDNIPVVSWLVLRGRCRGCGERIPAFHPLVELACPLLFLGAVWAIGIDDWRLLPVLWLIPVGVAVAVIDQRTLIVPTRIIWPSFAVSMLLTVLAAGLEGEWRWLSSAAIGLAVLAGPLFAIWFIHPRGMGFGDVRLTVLLGWNIGFFAGTRPVAPIVLTMISLFVAAVVGIVLGVVVMGARGRKAQVPFGPALIISAFVCIALAEQILDPFDVYRLTSLAV